MRQADPTETFDVTRSGSIGVSASAKVTLKVDENTPNLLYYGLVPVDSQDNTEQNKQIVVDNEVDLNNQVIVEG